MSIIWKVVAWVVLLGGVGLFLYSFFNADNNVKAGLLSFIGAAGVAIYTNYQSKKREVLARHFGEKRAAYMEMINLIFDIIRSIKDKKQVPESKMISQVMKFKKGAIVWGSAEVIEVWNNFELLSAKNPNTSEILISMEKILRAIREDLGHDDSSLEFGSLWGLIFTAEDKDLLKTDGS